jgi:[protein-PII] uridylyltransferase
VLRASAERDTLAGPASRAERLAAADRWLARLLGDPGPGIALVATGAYGRGEPAPGSDLDLMLLHRRKPSDPAVAALAERLWYPIWDAGVRLDHSVRTPEEALAIADQDLKTALGLLDLRHVAGDATLTKRLREAAGQRWRAAAGRRLPELRAACQRRVERHGELAFLLEPDLKEARGGLRDAHVIAAVAAAWIGGGLTAAARRAYHLLLDVRDALHQESGGSSDRLGLHEQDAVAARLGYVDAEALMRAVHQAGRTIAWTLDQTWRQVDAFDRSQRRKRTRTWSGRRAPQRRTIAEGVVAHDGEVLLEAGTDPAGDPATALRAAAAAASTGLPLARHTLERLAAEQPAMPEPWPAAARHALVTLLGAGTPAVGVLEDLDQSGVLARILPEWERVRSRPQRNPFHRWTVDRHLIETAVRAAPLVRRVSRPDLLLLAAFLHDLGKGWPGDHATTGARVAAGLGARLGLPPGDVSVLAALVRHHLLLAETATRRDLDDPATTRLVAEAVGDPGTLALLHALTEADALATGPSAWSPWKARLVETLARRVAAHLEGVAPPPPAEPPHERLRAAPQPLELTVEVDGDTIAVLAPDQPGLLWRVAGVLALHRLDVLAATVATHEGAALLTFTAQPRFGREPNWRLLRDELRRALDGQLPLEQRLAEREAAYPPTTPLAGRQAAEVRFQDHASDRATVVEVRCPDGPGVLYRITRALATCGVTIDLAKIATYGAEVVDTFYLRAPSGAPALDPATRSELVAAALAALTATP